MIDDQSRRQFINELWERFEELQKWATEHWPDQENPLTSADFVEGRKEILGLRNPAQAPGKVPEDREPEQGGAQYVDVTPAPWP
jgi:hypothetical protein